MHQLSSVKIPFWTRCIPSKSLPSNATVSSNSKCSDISSQVIFCPSICEFDQYIGWAFYIKYCKWQFAKSLVSIFSTQLQHFTSLSLMVSKHMAKFEIGFDSFGEDCGIKTFLNKCLKEYKARLERHFKDCVVIWFACAKVSDYDIGLSTTNQ